MTKIGKLSPIATPASGSGGSRRGDAGRPAVPSIATVFSYEVAGRDAQFICRDSYRLREKRKAIIVHSVSTNND